MLKFAMSFLSIRLAQLASMSPNVATVILNELHVLIDVAPENYRATSKRDSENWCKKRC